MYIHADGCPGPCMVCLYNPIIIITHHVAAITWTHRFSEKTHQDRDVSPFRVSLREWRQSLWNNDGEASLRIKCDVQEKLLHTKSVSDHVQSSQTDGCKVIFAFAGTAIQTRSHRLSQRHQQLWRLRLARPRLVVWGYVLVSDLLDLNCSMQAVLRCRHNNLRHLNRAVLGRKCPAGPQGMLELTICFLSVLDGRHCTTYVPNYQQYTLRATEYRLKHRELSQSNLGQWGYDKEKERDKHIQGNIEASTCTLVQRHAEDAAVNGHEHSMSMLAGLLCRG